MDQGVITHSRNYQDISHLCTGSDPEPIPSPSGSFPVDRFGEPGLVNGFRPRGLAERDHEQRNQPSLFGRDVSVTVCLWAFQVRGPKPGLIAEGFQDSKLEDVTHKTNLLAQNTA